MIHKILTSLATYSQLKTFSLHLNFMLGFGGTAMQTHWYIFILKNIFDLVYFSGFMLKILKN